MALINCPNCGKQISNKAERCVSCGLRLSSSDRLANNSSQRPNYQNNNSGSNNPHYNHKPEVVLAVIFGILILSVPLIWYIVNKSSNSYQEMTNGQQSKESFGTRMEKAIDQAGKEFNESQKAEEQRESRQIESARPEITIGAAQLYTEYSNNEVLADKNYKGKILQVAGVIKDIGTGLTDNQIYIILSSGNAFESVQCTFSQDYKNRISQMTKGQYVTIVGECTGKFIGVQMAHCRVN